MNCALSFGSLPLVIENVEISPRETSKSIKLGLDRSKYGAGKEISLGHVDVFLFYVICNKELLMLFKLEVKGDL